MKTHMSSDQVNSSSSSILKKIVVTGGPGAGKTAIVELARRQFSEHLVVIPEAASIIFGGGFWRHDSVPARKAAQRAIYYVQREFERLVIEEDHHELVLCDRGTLDGLAYWPDTAEDYFKELGTSLESEYARYNLVIHLKTPAPHQGYNHQNPLRTESAQQAAAIDQKITRAWEKHPKIFVIESTDDFFIKANQAIAIIQNELKTLAKPPL